MTKDEQERTLMEIAKVRDLMADRYFKATRVIDRKLQEIMKVHTKSPPRLRDYSRKLVDEAIALHKETLATLRVELDLLMAEVDRLELGIMNGTKA